MYVLYFDLIIIYLDFYLTIGKYACHGFIFIFQGHHQKIQLFHINTNIQITLLVKCSMDNNTNISCKNSNKCKVRNNYNIDVIMNRKEFTSRKFQKELTKIGNEDKDVIFS